MCKILYTRKLLRIQYHVEEVTVPSSSGVKLFKLTASLLEEVFTVHCTKSDFVVKPGARRRPVHTWFFEIAFVWEVGMCALCVCVCLPPGY